MITAHGGSLGTGRNSAIYFDNIGTFMADAIEVDVYKKNGLLYLSHLPSPFCYKKKVTLAKAFEFAKKHNVKINCDLKMKGLVRDVIALAKEMKAEGLLIFTGRVSIDDNRDLTEGQAYLNKIKGLPYRTKNVAMIKKALLDTGNPHIAGLNVNKYLVSDSFIRECKKEGVALSIFTVDRLWDIKKYVAFEPENITTNYPVVAARVLFERRNAAEEKR